MPKFSKRSLDNLATCHQDLQAIAHEAIKLADFGVTEGERTRERQRELVAQGKSKTLRSKHVHSPSLAFDFAPYVPGRGYLLEGQEAREACTYIAGIMRGIAHARGIALRWGGDWDSDGNVLDNGFDDLVHVELV